MQSCCNALDVSKQRVDGGDDSTNSNLSLKKSHSLMDAWTNTHNQITNVYKDNTTLIEALFNFKEHFFHVMQNGFNDKAHTLEVTLQASLHKSMDEAPATSDQSWNSMRIALDDYMRLSTAEVFDADQKASMSKVASAVDILYTLAFQSYLFCSAMNTCFLFEHWCDYVTM